MATRELCNQAVFTRAEWNHTDGCEPSVYHDYEPPFWSVSCNNPWTHSYSKWATWRSANTSVYFVCSLCIVSNESQRGWQRLVGLCGGFPTFFCERSLGYLTWCFFWAMWYRGAVLWAYGPYSRNDLFYPNWSFHKWMEHCVPKNLRWHIHLPQDW